MFKSKFLPFRRTLLPAWRQHCVFYESVASKLFSILLCFILSWRLKHSIYCYKLMKKKYITTIRRRNDTIHFLFKSQTSRQLLNVHSTLSCKASYISTSTHVPICPEETQDSVTPGDVLLLTSVRVQLSVLPEIVPHFLSCTPGVKILLTGHRDILL